jgi:hypothetical protein
VSAYDYSGVRENGLWLGRTGWRLFGLGLLFVFCALAYVGAIVLVVLAFMVTMGIFGS